MSIETYLKISSTNNVNFSQRGILGMSLLYYPNIFEYVDLFEDEEYTKVVIMSVDKNNLERILREPT